MSKNVPRVASVLPSATEILCFIGGRHLLVGRSHEDNFPADVSCLPVLTGQLTSFTTAREVDLQVSQALAKGQALYTLDDLKFIELRPDIILTQDICSVCAIDLPTVEGLAAKLASSPRIVSLNPMNLDGVLQSIIQLGDAVGLQAEASAALKGLHSRIEAVDKQVAEFKQTNSTRPRVAFIEWSDPIYVGGHWTPQLIERAGGCHPLNPGKDADGAGKSFAVSADELVKSEPDLVILCCCGLDLEATKREASLLQQNDWWTSLHAVKTGRVALVDGDAMFNRPGPRLVDALEWLCSVLTEQPLLAPPCFPVMWLKPGEKVQPLKRTREAPDIEEIHKAAVSSGQTHYTDPDTGYCVFTQLYMIERGWCCGSGCRHCPYGHQHVPADRKDSVKPPIVVPGYGCPRKSLPKPTDAH